MASSAAIRTSSGVKLSFNADEDDRLIEEVAKHPALYDLKNSSYKDQRLKDNIWLTIAGEVGRPVGECKKRWKNIKDSNDRRIRETNRTGSQAPPNKKNKKAWALQERLSFLHSTDLKRGSFSNVSQEDDEDSDDGFSVNDSVLQEEATGTENPVPRANISKKATVGPPSSTSTVIAAEFPSEDGNEMQIHKHPKPQKKTNYRETLALAIEKRSKERDIMIKELLVKEEDQDDVTLFFKSICHTVKQFPPDLQQRAKLETLTLVSNLEMEKWSRTQTPSGSVTVLQSPTYSNCSTNSPASTFHRPGSSSLDIYSPQEDLLSEGEVNAKNYVQL